METDKYIFLGDSYIDIEGGEKEVTQFIDDILNRKTKMESSTEPIPKTPVKLTKKNKKIISNKLILSNYFILYQHCGLLKKYLLQHAK